MVASAHGLRQRIIDCLLEQVVSKGEVARPSGTTFLEKPGCKERIDALARKLKTSVVAAR